MTSRRTEPSKPVPYVDLEGLEGKPLYDLTIAIKAVALDGASEQARLGVQGPKKTLSSFRGLGIPLLESSLGGKKAKVSVRFAKEWPKDVSAMLMLGPGDDDWILAKALSPEGKVDESRLEGLKKLAMLYGLPLRCLSYLNDRASESQVGEAIDVDDLGSRSEIVLSDPCAYYLIPAISDRADRFYKDIYGETKKRNVLASLFASGAFKPLPPKHHDFIKTVGALELSDDAVDWIFLEEPGQKEYMADLRYVLGI